MKDKTQVFYRKFRPQQLADVVGQEHVTRTLLNALAAGHTSHAYLFCGPRGTGKTSTGRILAKAVNCTKAGSGGKGDPCNKCAMCKAITDGSALDVIEIDAASHTGVDDVRELIERVNYAPAEARVKVYIIDEAHMLSTAASNALLKTLEEPPGNILFVLATTEIHKMLPTIISRCQRFDFRRLNYHDIEQKLARVCEAEKLSVAPEAMRVIARAARGGLRDAENLLEQLASYYGKDVGLADVQELLGIGSGEQARRLLQQIAAGDVSAGLESINQAVSEGLNLKQLDRDLVNYLRQMLLIKSGCERELDLTPDELAELKALAAEMSLEKIVSDLRLFGRTENELSGDSALPLELAVVDACLKPQAATPAAREEPVPPPPAGNPSPRKNSPARTENAAPASPAPADPPPPRRVPETKSEEPPSVSALEGAGSKLEQLVMHWSSLISLAPEQVKKSPAAAILRSAGVKPVALDDDTVVLSFRYPYHKEKIEEIENRKIVAGLIGRFLGQPCQVKCIYEPQENHLVREAQKLGARIISVEE